MVSWLQQQRLEAEEQEQEQDGLTPVPAVGSEGLALEPGEASAGKRCTQEGR